MKREWGKGIPTYNQSDIMTEAELLNFAMQIVMDYEIKPNKYEILLANDKNGAYPNFLLEKGNKRLFVIVIVAVAPNLPKPNETIKSDLLKVADQFNAACYIAQVGIGACDGDRFKASLALRGDAFYINYKGLELLSL